MIAIPLLFIYLEYMKTLIQKDAYTPIFITALLINTIAKTWKQPKCSIADKWINKL